jgi:hypothetical protein
MLPAELDRPGTTHPCRWTPAILAALEPAVAELGLAVHDPFAGTGVRLGQLCDRLGLAFTGTEIEAPFTVDPRVAQGDSTDPATYPPHPHVVVTSPAYPNGMADHFHARDGSRRHTYRQALAAIAGHDQSLHEHNMGRWGVRRGQRATARHFELADQCVRWWPAHVIVNVSDFPHRWALWPLVDRWRELLGRHGYVVDGELEVATPRQRNGANRHRADHETVLIARKAAA